MSSLVVGPFNRVEGDLEVHLDVADGKVASARVNSPLYRGFEQILRGKPPDDALVTAVGYQSSYLNDTASRTTGIGREALFYNKTDDMTAVGYRAGFYSGFQGPTFFSKEHTSVGTEAG